MCIPIGDLSILRFLLPLIYTTPALTPNNSDAGKKERKRERKKEKKAGEMHGNLWGIDFKDASYQLRVLHITQYYP